MDKPNDVEALRETLRGMPWQDLQEVAHSAGLSPSTVDKIRRGISKEPGVFKVQALLRALEARNAKAL
jgi:transcriptional regulator with XRE-family HTH domain